MSDDWALGLARFAARMSGSASLQADVELWDSINGVLGTPQGQRLAVAASRVFSLLEVSSKAPSPLPDKSDTEVEMTQGGAYRPKIGS